MNWDNEKKCFLGKMDKSKKGSIDEKVIPLLQAINAHSDYYTTSSCSGRVYFWRGTGRKNETEWIKVSHNLIDEEFFALQEKQKSGLIWLRFEPFIIHVACRNLESANRLLDIAKKIYKKSYILSASNKIIVEIHGSEFVEMPFYQDGDSLFSGSREWLVQFCTKKLTENWKKMELFLLLTKKI
ncbi:hypothetical protein HYX14_04025 [Candidatus Woesearchaeota archaeon]|nr:hypothetical protein [Candidatus Woesearchaeota archaeon]